MCCCSPNNFSIFCRERKTFSTSDHLFQIILDFLFMLILKILQGGMGMFNSYQWFTVLVVPCIKLCQFFLSNFATFTGNHLCWILFLIKLSLKPNLRIFYSMESRVLYEIFNCLYLKPFHQPQKLRRHDE